ncbi:hypothetical protein MTR_6g079530 [Medicago truncatula]|uniref:Uncharacterized protein n=1 Tax=Medicago truncatula TaxID=3880 RepID=A0A072UCZ9_MEDTR|nr:hypothetical protein MTR_6g079530 [Medicago truncatula]
MGKLFLTIESNKEHIFIMNSRYQISPPTLPPPPPPSPINGSTPKSHLLKQLKPQDNSTKRMYSAEQVFMRYMLCSFTHFTNPC